MDNRRDTIDISADDFFRYKFTTSFINIIKKNGLLTNDDDIFSPERKNTIQTRDINIIADKLASLYEHNISYFTREHTKKFAKILAAIIADMIIKGDITNINDLKEIPNLHYLLLTFSKNIPNKNLHTILPDGSKHNIKNYITRSGIYCKENNNIYITKNSNPTQYGFVSFESKEEVARFEKLANDKEYTTLTDTNTHELLYNSIFRSRHNTNQTEQPAAEIMSKNPPKKLHVT